MFKSVFSVQYHQLPQDAEVIAQESKKLPIQVMDSSGKVQFYIVSPEEFGSIGQCNDKGKEQAEVTSVEAQSGIAQEPMVEFYGIVYSPSIKVMALTGKRTFLHFTESELCRDYPNWNQAKGGNADFQRLAMASDRKAVMMANVTESEVADTVKNFLQQGYTTPSQLKPYIKARI
ncbi:MULTISPECIES: hypothetical protein [Vibrio]|uniref:hypothetical protein n=1 Tax=Vibrio TaxID=662 RepID=UPI001F1C75E7|nr:MULTISPECIES: hypothetical protein [Vibrio]